MANKPRIGSDPFQKKDPLGWIGGDSTERTDKSEGVQGMPSNPEKPSKVSKPSAPRTSSKSSNPSNPSKHVLPSPPSRPAHPGTPSTPPKGATTSKGLRPGWTRATFIVKEESLQQLKAVAYWDRKELKRVVEEAISQYLAAKIVQPIPEEH